MITNAKATNFKGLSFSQDLKKLNLIVGPMGIGKSAISEAIILATNGHIPGAGKTNQAIMDAYSGNDKLFISVNTNGSSFERRFVRSSKGKVSQKHKVNGNNASKEDFTAQFAIAGKPAIIDLQAFLELSDQKKIDVVFDLFPPKGDIEGLSDDIETLTNEKNALQADMKAAESLVKKLTADKAEIELPAGTLAEVTLEIERTTAEVLLARKNLEKQKVKDAEQAATERAEAFAKKNAEAEKERIEKEAKEKAEREVAEKAASSPPIGVSSEPRPAHGFRPDTTARNGEDFQNTVPPSPKPGAAINPEPVRKSGVYLSEKTISLTESIKAIIATMDKAGCTACAARLVARRELNKY